MLAVTRYRPLSIAGASRPVLLDDRPQDAQLFSERTSVSISVKPCTEDHELMSTARSGFRQCIFRKSRPCGHDWPSRSTARIVSSVLYKGGCFLIPICVRPEDQ